MAWAARTGRWLGGFVLLAVLGALLFVLFGLNLLKEPLARAVAEATGRELVIEGNLRPAWSWVHPRFRAERLRLSNPAWAQDDSLLSAEVVEVSVSLLPLLEGRLVVPDAHLRNAFISLEEDAQGRTTWDFRNGTSPPAASGWYVGRLTSEGSELRFRHSGLGIDVRRAMPPEVRAIAAR